MAVVRIFFAYQFAGARLNKIEREGRYTQALDEVNSALLHDGKPLRIEWQYWDIQSGAALSKEIFDRMDNADVYVFDLSDHNSNVYIELGYAMRAARESHREVIILSHDENSLSEIPSDLSGIVILRVNEENLQQKLTREIYGRLGRVITARRVIKETLSSCERGGLHLICPEIPPTLRSRHAEAADQNYIRHLKFADLDTLFFLRSKIAKHYPDAAVFEFTGDEYFIDSDAMQIVIGGPAWNRMAKLSQKGLPLQFVDGGDGQDDPLVVVGDSDNARFLPEFDDELLSSDVSYVARLSRGHGCKLLMLSGCRTFGVLGAAKCLFDEAVAVRNSEWLDVRCGSNDYVLAFRSAIISGSVVAESAITDAVGTSIRSDG